MYCVIREQIGIEHIFALLNRSVDNMLVCLYMFIDNEEWLPNWNMVWLDIEDINTWFVLKHIVYVRLYIYILNHRCIIELYCSTYNLFFSYAGLGTPRSLKNWSQHSDRHFRLNKVWIVRSFLFCDMYLRILC